VSNIAYIETTYVPMYVLEEVSCSGLFVGCISQNKNLTSKEYFSIRNSMLKRESTR